MNLLIITADDLSYAATGIGGCEIKDITPNIDNLAKNGFYFDHAHTTVGLCQPSRSVLMTGLYPWNNGAFGFEPIKEGTETLVTILKRHNYHCGIIGKESHLSPPDLFQWDYVRSERDLKGGKTPSLYHQYCKEFMAEQKAPFFLMVNSHDPHRDFPVAKYDPASVNVPCFLSDNDETRVELAQYYTAVNRCDETVGAIIEAIVDNSQNTLVIFTSDHGMAFPFVKANCYHYSSRVPLVFSHASITPKKDSKHMVSGVDFLPTILDIMGLPAPHTDGCSYLEILNGGTQDGRDFVYTCLCKNFPGTWHQTRALHMFEACYIRNFWSNGINSFVEDGCLDKQKSFAALPLDKKLHLRHRLPEELYDLRHDPCAQHPLLDDKKLAVARKIMMDIAKKTKDDLASSFLHPNPSARLI